MLGNIEFKGGTWIRYEWEYSCPNYESSSIFCWTNAPLAFPSSKLHSLTKEGGGGGGRGGIDSFLLINTIYESFFIKSGERGGVLLNTPVVFIFSFSTLEEHGAFSITKPPRPFYGQSTKDVYNGKLFSSFQTIVQQVILWQH